MTDYLKKFGNKVNKFQEGGAMPAPEAAPAPQGGGQPDIEGMLAQYAQQPDPELAMAICDALVGMMAQQGGGQPMPAARTGMRMPAAPRFKLGGKLA